MGSNVHITPTQSKGSCDVCWWFERCRVMVRGMSSDGPRRDNSPPTNRGAHACAHGSKVDELRSFTKRPPHSLDRSPHTLEQSTHSLDRSPPSLDRSPPSSYAPAVLRLRCGNLYGTITTHEKTITNFSSRPREKNFVRKSKNFVRGTKFLENYCVICPCGQIFLIFVKNKITFS